MEYTIKDKLKASGFNLIVNSIIGSLLAAMMVYLLGTTVATAAALVSGMVGYGVISPLISKESCESTLAVASFVTHKLPKDKK